MPIINQERSDYGGPEALLLRLLPFAIPVMILVLEPYYTITTACYRSGRVHCLSEHNLRRFALPADDVLDSFVTASTRAILFSTRQPHGACTESELRRFLDWAKRHNIYVIGTKSIDGFGSMKNLPLH